MQFDAKTKCLNILLYRDIKPFYFFLSEILQAYDHKEKVCGKYAKPRKIMPKDLISV